MADERLTTTGKLLLTSFVTRDEFVSLAGGPWQAGAVVLNWPLTHARQIIAWWLLRGSGPSCRRRLGQQALAKASGFNKSTVEVALRQMVKKGLIRVGPDKAWRWRRPADCRQMQSSGEPQTTGETGCSAREMTSESGTSQPNEQPADSVVHQAGNTLLPSGKYAAQRASGDTELVPGLCQLFGDKDRGVWLTLDRLAIGEKTVCHGDRGKATALLLGIAREVKGDKKAGEAAAAFLAKVRDYTRFPSLTAAWLRSESDGN